MCSHVCDGCDELLSVGGEGLDKDVESCIEVFDVESEAGVEFDGVVGFSG